MGMYTEFHYNVQLVKDCPDSVFAILRYMLAEGKKPDALPDHDLFKTSRWESMFSSDSYYFATDTLSTLRRDESGDWFLCVRCNVKNYDSEIEKFINWFAPYVDNVDELLGFYRYEETIIPTLVYGSRVNLREVVSLYATQDGSVVTLPH